MKKKFFVHFVIFSGIIHWTEARAGAGTGEGENGVEGRAGGEEVGAEQGARQQDGRHGDSLLQLGGQSTAQIVYLIERCKYILSFILQSLNLFQSLFFMHCELSKASLFP